MKKVYFTLGFLLLFSAPFSANVNAFADPLFSAQSGNLKYSLVENPDTHFRHYVATYVPKSLSADEISHAPVLFFLHGGSSAQGRPNPNLNIANGEYTCTDSPLCSKEYGKTQIASYWDASFQAFSESRKVILVFPGSNIGWDANSLGLIKNLEERAKSELRSSDAAFYLSGHSMGAMGVIRLSGTLRSNFKAFIALSGTLNLNEMSEAYVRTLLGLPLYLVNEEEAVYSSFLTSSASLLDFLQNLALKYKLPSFFEVMVAHANHNTILKELPSVFDTAQAGPGPIDQAELDLKPLSFPLLHPAQNSNWIGNLTCGKFLGTHRVDWNLFHVSKYLYIDLQAELEGLYNVNADQISPTYLPRQTSIELGTFAGSAPFENIKAMPKTLAKLTQSEGSVLCVLSSFQSLPNPASPRYLVTAGQTVDEARQKMRVQYRNASQAQ